MTSLFTALYAINIYETSCYKISWFYLKVRLNDVTNFKPFGLNNDKNTVLLRKNVKK